VVNDKARKDLIGQHTFWRQPRRPDCRAYQQEQKELQNDHDARPYQRGARIAQRARCQKALNDELISSM
jgi:hypothetical protein